VIAARLPRAYFREGHGEAIHSLMKDLLSCYGSVALVTGASSGIGEAFALTLARQGFTVFAAARRAERLEALKKQVVAIGRGEIIPVTVDLQDPAASQLLYDSVRARGLSVDVLVNNAGFGRLGTLESISRGDSLGMVDLNCRAVVDITWRFLPEMKERKRGGIIILSSVVGTIPAPWFAVYSATKAFDLYFGEALYAECRGTGVDVVTILPGLTRTEFQASSGLREYHSPYRTAEQVVESACNALGRKSIVVDGIFNKVMAHGSRFLPRGALIALSRFVMRKELKL